VQLVVPKAIWPSLSGTVLEKASHATLANSTIDMERGTLESPVVIGAMTLPDVDVRVLSRFPELLVGAHALQHSMVMIDQRSRTVTVCPR
jgi:hypothetical protein